MKIRLLIVVLSVMILTPGFPLHAQEVANLTDSCVEQFAPGQDYFPDKVMVEVAEGFTVAYFNNYKLVTVSTPWQGAERPLQYLLVQCGTPAPEGYPDVPVVEVPVRRLVSMSTSFLPHLTAQGLLDRLVGIDTALYTTNEAVLELVRSGEVVEIGGGGSGLEVNVEGLIDLQPNLIMTQRFSAADQTYPVIEQAGLPVIINADFLDTSPLAVAEWGKFIALFFNTEAEATRLFAGVQERYRALRDQARSVTRRPTVLAGTPYSGTWYIPGGRSYLAQLLRDSGADYLWSDDPSAGSLALDFESVFDRAGMADYWVNVNQFWGTLADALAEDERYATFAAYESGNIFSNNARVNANGGSDYYESGYANPDVILADLVRIFHPDLVPDHELYFYKQVPVG